jgi:gas vesicle protein
VAGITPKKLIAGAAVASVPYFVGKKVQQQQRQQEPVVEKTAAFIAGVSDGLSKVGYYQIKEDVVEQEADRWRQRARERGDGGAMSQYKNRGTAGGTALGGVIGGLSGLSYRPNRGKGALVGAGLGAATGAVIGRLAGKAKGEGERRLAKKLDSMPENERSRYIARLVRDRMHTERMANQIIAAHAGRTNVSVYR